MARLHGRFAPETKDRSVDPDRDTVNTTPGFKLTERGPGVERFEHKDRVPQQVDFHEQAAARAAARAEQKAANRVAMRAQIDARVAARAAAPDLDHLKRENAIPATPPRPNAEPASVTARPESEMNPKDVAEIKQFRRDLRVRAALREQDPMADKTVNTGLHVVDTPGGVAKYHHDRQAAALELARGLEGKDRKFALQLAKEHASGKRAAGGGGVVGDKPGHPFRGNQYGSGKGRTK